MLLAVRLARHTAGGWDNAALPDDIADIAALLNLRTAPRSSSCAASRPDSSFFPLRCAIPVKMSRRPNDGRGIGAGADDSARASILNEEKTT